METSIRSVIAAIRPKGATTAAAAPASTHMLTNCSPNAVRRSIRDGRTRDLIKPAASPTSANVEANAVIAVPAASSPNSRADRCRVSTATATSATACAMSERPATSIAPTAARRPSPDWLVIGLWTARGAYGHFPLRVTVGKVRTMSFRSLNSDQDVT